MRQDMTQADIEIAFRSSLLDCMTDYGADGVPVLQHYDYLKKGRRSEAVYFTLQNPVKVGNSYRKYDPNNGHAGHTERQHWQADISVTVVADEDAQDLALTVFGIMGSLPFIELMRAAGVGVQGSPSITTIPAKDDHDNWAYECSGVLPITFNRESKPNTPTVEAANLDIHRV